MIRIGITAEAYAAIAAMLPFGTVASNRRSTSEAVGSFGSGRAFSPRSPRCAGPARATATSPWGWLTSRGGATAARLFTVHKPFRRPPFLRYAVIPVARKPETRTDGFGSAHAFASL